jgi:hypothetical protein
LIPGPVASGLNFRRGKNILFNNDITTGSMVEMWDERYSAEAYAYGTEPNVFFGQTLDALKPGGTLIIEAFAKNQLRYSSAGPRDEALLLSSQDLANEFNGLKINYLSEEEVVFDEGPIHQGKAAVVKMVAVK